MKIKTSRWTLALVLPGMIITSGFSRAAFGAETPAQGSRQISEEELQSIYDATKRLIDLSLNKKDTKAEAQNVVHDSLLPLLNGDGVMQHAAAATLARALIYWIPSTELSQEILSVVNAKLNDGLKDINDGVK